MSAYLQIANSYRKGEKTIELKCEAKIRKENKSSYLFLTVHCSDQRQHMQSHAREGSNSERFSMKLTTFIFFETMT